MAREILSQATDADLSNETFRLPLHRKFDCPGDARDVCRRTGLGTAHAGGVGRGGLRSADGAWPKHGIANAGYRAIDSLRLKKATNLGADVTPDHTPLEAGLGWAAKLKTDTPFLGREALEQQKANGLAKRLAFFAVDDPEVVLLGRETIYRNGERVGWLTSGGLGTQAIGMGYVRNKAGVDRDFLSGGEY